MSYVFFHITAALYLAATLVYTGYLVSHGDKFARVARDLLIGGFLAHTITLLGRLAEGGRIPTTSLHESLLLFAWLTVGICLFLLFKYNLSVLGAFVSPFALLLVITASLLPSEIVPLTPVLKSWWLPVHVTLAILGNAFFALACILGVTYLIQEHYLKSHKVGGMYFVLPSLDILDELGYKCLTYGFPLLTLGIITGVMWSEYAFGTYWMWKHRQVWSMITWFLYAALLHGRLTTGWRGRKSAKFSVVAFGVLLGSSLIIYVLLGEGHGISNR
ncbi:MAG: c-type cytochrome biogenesis protein CcsB [Thermodesulfobacteriota bacterium]